MQAFFFDPNSIAKYNLIMKLAHLFKYSFACIIATLSIAMTQQQNTQSSVQVIEEVNFKPHMVEHLIKGCPENSKCSKETGKTSEKFKEVFTNGSLKEKKSFVKEFGLPFTFWTTTVAQDSVITYQSRCIHHKTEKDKLGKVLVERQEIYEGIRFTKNINEITSFHGVILNQMIKENYKWAININFNKKDNTKDKHKEILENYGVDSWVIDHPEEVAEAKARYELKNSDEFKRKKFGKSHRKVLDDDMKMEDNFDNKYFVKKILYFAKKQKK